jgi:hypothetical protein
MPFLTREQMQQKRLNREKFKADLVNARGAVMRPHYGTDGTVAEYHAANPTSARKMAAGLEVQDSSGIQSPYNDPFLEARDRRGSSRQAPPLPDPYAVARTRRPGGPASFSKQDSTPQPSSALAQEFPDEAAADAELARQTGRVPATAASTTIPAKTRFNLNTGRTETLQGYDSRTGQTNWSEGATVKQEDLARSPLMRAARAQPAGPRVINGVVVKDGETLDYANRRAVPTPVGGAINGQLTHVALANPAAPGSLADPYLAARRRRLQQPAVV